MTAVASIPAPDGIAGPARPERLTVFVRGLRVEAGIGIYGHEQGRLQTLVIDVALDLDPHSVERLADTVNYETVAEHCCAIIADGHVGLVETFADRLALDCMKDQRVQRVVVRIEKPGALDQASAAGCEVAYSR